MRGVPTSLRDDEVVDAARLLTDSGERATVARIADIVGHPHGTVATRVGELRRLGRIEPGHSGWFKDD